ncbi:MAG: hypothetical protein ACKO85_00280, partial [Isosphaeraceae bacterium]
MSAKPTGTRGGRIWASDDWQKRITIDTQLTEISGNKKMAAENKAPYTMVVGLEVHVQLLTESKMFSWTGTEFGLPPNTLCDPVNLGMPGTLPVMNGKAFNMALKTALACGCTISRYTKWDRKNYFYPDLPKKYQISQYDLPFSLGGSLPIPMDKEGNGGGSVRLTRIHLEEDTGKMVHTAGQE